MTGLQEKMVLAGQTKSTLSNYARKIAHICLHYRRLPQDISEKEINRYLADLARRSKTPSLIQFKHTIYGLRYCHCKKGKMVTIERFDLRQGTTCTH